MLSLLYKWATINTRFKILHLLAVTLRKDTTVNKGKIKYSSKIAIVSK